MTLVRVLPASPTVKGVRPVTYNHPPHCSEEREEEITEEKGLTRQPSITGVRVGALRRPASRLETVQDDMHEAL